MCQEITKHISHPLCLYKHQAKRHRSILLFFVIGRENVQEHRALFRVLDVFNALFNVLVRTADTADRDLFVRTEEISRQGNNVLWKRCREHERLSNS